MTTDGRRDLSTDTFACRHYRFRSNSHLMISAPRRHSPSTNSLSGARSPHLQDMHEFGYVSRRRLALQCSADDMGLVMINDAHLRYSGLIKFIVYYRIAIAHGIICRFVSVPRAWYGRAPRRWLPLLCGMHRVAFIDEMLLSADIKSFSRHDIADMQECAYLLLTHHGRGLPYWRRARTPRHDDRGQGLIFDFMTQCLLQLTLHNALCAADEKYRPVARYSIDRWGFLPMNDEDAALIFESRRVCILISRHEQHFFMSCAASYYILTWYFDLSIKQSRFQRCRIHNMWHSRFHLKHEQMIMPYLSRLATADCWMMIAIALELAARFTRYIQI